MSRSRSNTARIADVAPLFAALGDEARLQIVTRLCREGPLSIARLTEGSAISRQAVTKHLDALAARGPGRERAQWSGECVRAANPAAG